MHTLAAPAVLAAGREAELSALLEEHERAGREDGAAFAVVSGPAGIGKSSLLAATATALRLRGVAVIEARAARGAAEAFGLIRALAGDLQELATLRGTPERVLAGIARRLALLTGKNAAQDHGSL